MLYNVPGGSGHIHDYAFGNQLKQISYVLSLELEIQRTYIPSHQIIRLQR